MHSFSSITALFFSAALLQGCNWVDATGEQERAAQVDLGVLVPVEQIDTPTQALVEGQALLLLENSTNNIRLEGSGNAVRYWQWELLDESDGELCEALDGYDQGLAADSLSSACTLQSDCDIGFEPPSGVAASEVVMSLPRLKAPVALNYTLSAELADGQTLRRNHTLCVVSVNESPAAGNDTYRVIAGQQLTVLASDANSLIANDIDDVDVQNQALHIDPQAVLAPRYADQFSLMADGEFTYRAFANTPLEVGDSEIDSFVYSLSDGLHTVQATATITIVASNEEPQAVGNLPDVQINVSDVVGDPAYELDVSDYFSDADGDQLTYSVNVNELPEALLIQISEQGLLSIVVVEQAPDPEAGTWLVEVAASDGLSSAGTGFLLMVTNSQAGNRPPTVTDIANHTVQNTFSYDISGFFHDPDGDELTFSSSQLPPSVIFSPSGILSGYGNDQNAGNHFITIKATDPSGSSVEDGFLLRIND